MVNINIYTQDELLKEVSQMGCPDPKAWLESYIASFGGASYSLPLKKEKQIFNPEEPQWSKNIINKFFYTEEGSILVVKTKEMTDEDVEFLKYHELGHYHLKHYEDFTEIAFNMEMEKQADQWAVKYLGKEAVKKSLIKIFKRAKEKNNLLQVLAWFTFSPRLLALGMSKRETIKALNLSYSRIILGFLKIKLIITMFKIKKMFKL
jgi:hypothetical protein